MIRVALVHRDLHQVTRGGICTVYRSLAAHLTEQGASVTLITQESPHPVRMPGVTVVSLPRTENLSDHRDAVAEALHDVAPDVVDCSTWEAETLHYLALPRKDRARVLVRGEFSAASLGAPDLARDERQLVHAAERVIAVSQYAARDLAQEYGISLPRAVPNGVDRARFAAEHVPDLRVAVLAKEVAPVSQVPVELPHPRARVWVIAETLPVPARWRSCRGWYAGTTHRAKGLGRRGSSQRGLRSDHQDPPRHGCPEGRVGWRGGDRHSWSTSQP